MTTNDFNKCKCNSVTTNNNIENFKEEITMKKSVTINESIMSVSNKPVKIKKAKKEKLSIILNLHEDDNLCPISVPNNPYVKPENQKPEAPQAEYRLWDMDKDRIILKDLSDRKSFEKQKGRKMSDFLVLQDGATFSYDFSSCKPIVAGGNTKLGDTMGSFSKLPGNGYYYVPKMGDVLIKGSCGNHCAGCGGCDKDNKELMKLCYVFKSFGPKPSAMYGQAWRTLLMRYDTESMFAAIHRQLEGMREKFKIVRLNQAGEIETRLEFRKWIGMAQLHPETKFYIYTKAFDSVCPVLDELGNENVPENFVVLFSIWHEYGIAEYLKYQHYRCVKAFVYDDRTFDYAAHGINIQTYCHAYNEKGKLNHEVTCDKCLKCVLVNDKWKIVGCYAH